MKKKILLLLCVLMLPFNIKAYSNKVIPGGKTIGIEVSSKGIMIVGFYKINGKYNKGNPELKIGDYITKINGENVNTVDEMIKLIKDNKENKIVKITFSRNKSEKETILDLIDVDGISKTGLYVKDKISGIGTLSYIDPESNVYGALGHEIIESNSKEMIFIDEGYIFKNIITSIERSSDGNPGSKDAKFYKDKVYGDIKKNTKYGIYGNVKHEILNDETMEVKKLSEVNLGKAYIRTVIRGEEVKEYEIKITDINKNSKLKSISFEITDQDLIKETGGIVQGMSGSPIIQDGYLVGAVTHVLMDDVTKGYGISIITMLDEGDKLINEN